MEEPTFENNKKPSTQGYCCYAPILTIKDELQAFFNESQVCFESILGNIDAIQEELEYRLQFAERWKEKARTRKEKSIIKRSTEETKKELAEKIEQIVIELKKLEKTLEKFC